MESRRTVGVALGVCDTTTVYRIQPGRGFDEAASVLGVDAS